MCVWWLVVLGGFLPFLEKKKLSVREPLIHIQYNNVLHMDLHM